ncbi:MAG: excinuclease ABC subunit A, partial [Bacteroidaceae bacterium]|nr:excinuclease ABC subunit A [Bacteroidaceae bacterium]
MNIDIKNARVNNLKNISLSIPHNKLIVVTGVSGSGKSSLAFDTLYAEGQRRYVESLSAYIRQFLGRMHKPECDYIKNLPPAIAIEQKVISRNPRSTVGTTTEIYEYLKLLFSRIGRTYSPLSGQEVRKHSAEDVLAKAKEFSPGTRLLIAAPMQITDGRTLEKQLEIEILQGYQRIIVNNEIVRIEDFLEAKSQADDIYLLIDRLSLTGSDSESRLLSSVETAFYEGNGECRLIITPSMMAYNFSTCFEADGITFEEPSANLFSFNSPAGACDMCEGFGRIIGIDEKLVIPDSSKSVYDGCVQCWHGEKMGEWLTYFIRQAAHDNFPIFTPYYELEQKHKDWLWYGLPSDPGWENPEDKVCINNFFEMVKRNQYKIQYRVMLSRYRGKTVCPKCHGNRLKKEAGYVKVAGRSITDIVEMPVSELQKWFKGLTADGSTALQPQEKEIAERLLTEIMSRLQFLCDVGLGYLTLNRASNTLSGGESQRINLTTQLGSALVGSLYILDEPSIGLHSRDTEQLIGVLRHLCELGNTVVVVEHDEEIMRAADYIIDIGPNAGSGGGEVVYEGQLNGEALPQEAIGQSYTLKYLTGELGIPVPSSRRAWNRSITVKGARMHNLKGINAQFPLNAMTAVTGVSGSGKSSLVKGILYPALRRKLDLVADLPGEHQCLEGDIKAIASVEMIDQNPIGKSARSNAATYVKAYDS